MTRPIFARGLGTSPAGPPGANGTNGTNGLPGVNAVANDTATASYISTPSSATATALSASIADYLDEHGGGGGAAALVPGLRIFDGMVPMPRSALSMAPPGSNTLTSNGTDTAGMYVLRHDVSGGLVKSVRLVYANSIGTDTAGANPITVRAAVDVQNGGSPVPVTFNNADSVVIPPDGQAVSDPLFISGNVLEGIYGIPEAPPYVKPATNPYGFFNVRTYVTVGTSGQAWPLNHQCGLSGDGAESGTSVTDKRLTGTVTGAGFGTFAYGPSMVLAGGAAPLPIVLGMTDSIGGGAIDDAGHFGWFDRAMRGAIGSLHSLRYSQGGSKAPYMNITGFGGHGAKGRALPALEGVSHCIYASGINYYFGQSSAISQSANDQAKREMWGDWLQLAELGMKVYAVTLMPYTNSSDGWTTTGGQTPRATEANRVDMNTWIRSVPSPLTGVIDLADVVESSRNSGLWKPNYSQDGLHPKAAGHAAAAAAVPTSSFTL